MNLNTKNGRAAAIDIINSELSKHNSDAQTLKNQGESIMDYLTDEDLSNDNETRKSLIIYCTQINDAFNELKFLNNEYVFKDPSIYKWINIDIIDFYKYIPKHIKLEKSSMTDLTMCYSFFKSFNPYNKRNNFLKHTSYFPYDDDAINVRSSTNLNVSKTKVSRKRVVKDISMKEFTTSDTPTLPTDFSVIKNDKMNGLYKQIILSDMIINPPSINLIIDQLMLSPTTLLTKKSFIVSDINHTEIFAEKALRLIPRALHYQFDKFHYGILRTYNVKIIKESNTIKEQLRTYYNNSSDDIRYYVYNNPELEEYHKDFYYYVTFDVELIKDKFSKDMTDPYWIDPRPNPDYNPDMPFDPDHPDANPPLLPPLYDLHTRVQPSTEFSDDAVKDICEDIKSGAIKSLEDCKAVYDNANEITRNDLNNPDAHYDFFHISIARYNLIDIEECYKMCRFIITDVKQYADNRINSLINDIIDSDNIGKMHKLLLNRLTKNTGTLLMWYNNVIQYDNSYFKHNNEIKELKRFLKDALIVNASSNSDNKIYYHYKNCKYIDIDDIDELYGKSKFYSGDKIYIKSGYKYEQENYIDKVSYIDVNDTNSININGNLNEMKKKRIVRLILRYPLEDWCYNNTNNIKVMKKLIV